MQLRLGVVLLGAVWILEVVSRDEWGVWSLNFGTKGWLSSGLLGL